MPSAALRYLHCTPMISRDLSKAMLFNLKVNKLNEIPLRVCNESLNVTLKIISTNCVQQGLQTPREEIAFTAWPKIHSHSQIFRYGQSIFCLPRLPNFSDIFDLCLHWVSPYSVLTY